MKITTGISILTLLALAASLGACAGGGSSRVTYSAGLGYGGYYGRSPYGYYRPPVIIGGGGPDIDYDRPEAVPLPEPDMDFGMPDAGFDDFGDFDF